MVGAGGGRSVLTADLCEEIGLSVPPLPEDVERKVAEKAPDMAGWLTNPVDQSMLAGSGLGGAQVLEWLDESPGIDLLVANVGEPWAFGRPNAEAIIERVTERFIQVGTKTAKPFAVVLGPSDYADEGAVAGGVAGAGATGGGGDRGVGPGGCCLRGRAGTPRSLPRLPWPAADPRGCAVDD